jgi:hypothetical protein
VKGKDHKERWMEGVRWSMTNHGLTEEDTTDRHMEKLKFWVKEKHCVVDKSLDDDDKYIYIYFLMWPPSVFSTVNVALMTN